MICLDPRDLKKAIKHEYHPMNTIEDLVKRLNGANYFSVLDADNGFTGQSCRKTLQYTEIRQRAMNTLFSDMNGVVCVMDDILVWGCAIEDHEDRLMAAFDRARAENLKLNKTKCKIGLQEVDYICHIITNEGLKASPTKIAAVQKMQQPHNKGGVQWFLDLVTYPSKFIPNMLETSAPQRELLASDVEWHGDKPQQKSFETLEKCSH